MICADRCLGKPDPNRKRPRPSMAPTRHIIREPSRPRRMSVSQLFPLFPSPFLLSPFSPPSFSPQRPPPSPISDPAPSRAGQPCQTRVCAAPDAPLPRASAARLTRPPRAPRPAPRAARKRPAARRAGQQATGGRGVSGSDGGGGGRQRRAAAGQADVDSGNKIDQQSSAAAP